MGFQSWCASRREQRNHRLNAMMAVGPVRGMPSEEEFLATRARIDAERAARKKAREEAAAAAAAE